MMTGFADATETELSAGSDVGDALALAGTKAGTIYGEAVGTGANDALGKTKLSGLLGADGKPLASSLESEGLLAGTLAGGAVGKATEDELTKAKPAVEKAATGLYKVIGGAFTKLGAIVEGTGIGTGSIFTKIGTNVQTAGQKADKTAGQFTHLKNISLITGAAVAVGIGYESVKAATDFQGATASLAASGDLTTKTANAIGQGFQGTAFDAQDSSTAITSAYATVVGKLETVDKSSKTTAGSLKFMNQAMTLNDATQGDLTTTTGALASVIQSFGQKLKSAAGDSNLLFNASRSTGVGVGTVATTVDTLHQKLIASNVSLSDITALMVSLAKTGGAGGKSVRLVATGLTTLLGGSKAVNAQLSTLSAGGGKIVTLEQQLAALKAAPSATTTAKSPYATQIADLKAAIASYGSATKSSPAGIAVANLKQQVAELTAEQDKWKASNVSTGSSVANQKKAIEAQIVALSKNNKELFDSKGQFIGVTKTVALLHTQFKTLTSAQQIAAAKTLFGGSAAVWLKVIQAGPASITKLKTSLGQSGSAAKAAAKQDATLKGELQKLKSGVKDVGTSIGLALIPKLTTATTDLGHMAKWLEKNKGAAKDLEHGVETAGAALALWWTGAKIVSALSAIGKVAKALGLVGTAGEAAATGIAGGEAAGAAGAAGGAIAAGGAATGALVLGAGVGAFVGTTELLHHTVAGDAVDELIYGKRNAKPTAKLGSATEALLKKYGGIKGLEAHDAALRKSQPQSRSPIRPGAKPTILSTYLNGQKIATATSRAQASKVRK